LDFLSAAIASVNFAINANFANPASNQLGVLRAEIEDKDFVGMDIG
jgi:hypothetical protein